MKIPSAVQQILRRLAESYPYSMTVESRRAFMRKAGEQLGFSVGPGWGYYKTEGDNPPSKDLLPYLDPLSVKYGWDIIDGATGALTLGGEDVKLTADAVFHPLAPVNWLGETPTPPDPPRPPSDPCADLRQQVAALIAQVAHLQDALMVLSTEALRDGQTVHIGTVHGRNVRATPAPTWVLDQDEPPSGPWEELTLRRIKE